MSNEEDDDDEEEIDITLFNVLKTLKDDESLPPHLKPEIALPLVQIHDKWKGTRAKNEKAR